MTNLASSLRSGSASFLVRAKIRPRSSPRNRFFFLFRLFQEFQPLLYALHRPEIINEKPTLEDTFQTNTLQWILSDHLSSASVTANADGTWNSTIKYTAFGEVREKSGVTETKYRYTGQLAQDVLGLDYYVARWYDPYLNRWIQPDPIIPTGGEGGDVNAVGFLEGAYSTPLTVDYHENVFLERINQENLSSKQNNDKKIALVPTNPMVFDRYAYALCNPLRYNDPSGHCPACAAAIIGGVGFTISAPVLIIGGLVVVAGVVAYDTFAPGKEERHAELNGLLSTLSSQVTYDSNAIQASFARPRNNQAQNKQFEGAIQEIERQLGRKLTQDEVQQIHRALHDLEDPGFWDIVEEGLREVEEHLEEGLDDIIEGDE